MGLVVLSESDVAFLQHAIMERPVSSGNQAFSRCRDVVRVRLQQVESSRQIPDELVGTSSEDFLTLISEVYSKGKGEELENTVVHHMMMHVLHRTCALGQIRRCTSTMFEACLKLEDTTSTSFELNLLPGCLLGWLADWLASWLAGWLAGSQRTPPRTPNRLQSMYLPYF